MAKEKSEKGKSKKLVYPVVFYGEIYKQTKAGKTAKEAIEIASEKADVKLPASFTDYPNSRVWAIMKTVNKKLIARDPEFLAYKA